jgi:hypothetical protein
MKNNLTRRGFFKGAGSGLAASALLAVSSPQARNSFSPLQTTSPNPAAYRALRDLLICYGADLLWMFDEPNGGFKNWGSVGSVADITNVPSEIRRSLPGMLGDNAAIEINNGTGTNNRLEIPPDSSWINVSTFTWFAAVNKINNAPPYQRIIGRDKGPLWDTIRIVDPESNGLHVGMRNTTQAGGAFYETNTEYYAEDVVLRGQPSSNPDGYLTEPGDYKFVGFTFANELDRLPHLFADGVELDIDTESPPVAPTCFRGPLEGDFEGFENGLTIGNTRYPGSYGYGGRIDFLGRVPYVFSADQWTEINGILHA